MKKDGIYVKRKKKQKRIVYHRLVICFIVILAIIGVVYVAGKNIINVFFNNNSQNTNSDNIIVNNNVASTLNEDLTPNKEEDYIFSVCIDAGHGGKDPGSEYNKLYEKDDDLALALAIQEYLTSYKVKVVMTRTEDIFIEKNDRPGIANKEKVNYMVSIHRNSGQGNGVEVWINNKPSEENIALAEKIMSNLEKTGISRNRGVRYGTAKNENENYAINKYSLSPSVIVEMGFINNDEDNRLFDANLKQYAKDIGDALLSTYKEFNVENVESKEEAKIGGDEEEIPYKPEQIENVENINNTELGWGQGTNYDGFNRPTSCIEFQEKYEMYQAHFIGKDKKIIYLTFDEGYENGFTNRILDVLKEKDVQAVFFCTLPFIKDNPELIQRMINEGHEVGNHSVTHPSSGFPSLTIEQQKEEIEGVHKYMNENYKYDMHLFRYPAGLFSEQSLAVVNNLNYKSVFWSFAYLDYDTKNQPDLKYALDKLIERIHPGAIYLLHAVSETNTKILGDFIDKARDAGYSFERFQ